MHIESIKCFSCIFSSKDKTLRVSIVIEAMDFLELLLLNFGFRYTLLVIDIENLVEKFIHRGVISYSGWLRFYLKFFSLIKYRGSNTGCNISHIPKHRYSQLLFAETVTYIYNLFYLFYFENKIPSNDFWKILCKFTPMYYIK